MSVQSAYFDQLYQRADDPWSLETRWYERRKYALTMASLPRERYRRGFEPGCSIGVLTALLAARCESLLATDVAMDAVNAARERTAAHGHVEVAQLRVPQHWPTGRFDLVVLSEIGYYLSATDLVEVVKRSVDVLDHDGALVAVHWRHAIEDLPLTGDVIHETIAADSRLEVLSHHEEADFLIDVFVRSPSLSVASLEGLVR